MLLLFQKQKAQASPPCVSADFAPLVVRHFQNLLKYSYEEGNEDHNPKFYNIMVAGRNRIWIEHGADRLDVQYVPGRDSYDVDIMELSFNRQPRDKWYYENCSSCDVLRLLGG